MYILLRKYKNNFPFHPIKVKISIFPYSKVIHKRICICIICQIENRYSYVCGCIKYIVIKTKHKI